MSDKVWVVMHYGSESSMLGIYSSKKKAVAVLDKEAEDSFYKGKAKVVDYGSNVNLEFKNDWEFQAFEYVVDSEQSVNF